MTYIAKPKVHHPSLQKNALGLTRRDYEGAITTLCAGCGHDSITAAIIQAFWELSIAAAHAWPSCRASAARRRRRPTSCARPTASTACTAACRRSPPAPTPPTATLIYIGVSGDGDSLSIGLGQLCHAIRRNVNVLYVLENNGVYGLTKGQFSASADPGSTSKKGEANTMEAIDGVLLALTLGATFVARSFSGDKAQLVPIIKAGLAHTGFAFIDVISPCVTFNDHEGSTKSYAYTREHERRGRPGRLRAAARRDHRRLRAGHARKSVMMHDGSWVTLRKVAEDYDPTDRDRAYAYIRERQKAGEVVTGLLYISPDSKRHARAERARCRRR